jgi:hypothetical protein
MLVSEVRQKMGHSRVLVGRALKVFRETARGEVRRDLGVVIDRAADRSDERTY